MRSAILYIWCVLLLLDCRPRTEKPEAVTEEPGTPVTVTSIDARPMEDYLELNATSAFLQKWVVRANATGYLQTADVQLNKYVNLNQPLYSVKTKEAASIGNSVSILDTSFHFTGINIIRANGSGFLSQVNHQKGDYVQDGDQLAVITDTHSFVFLLDLPYELRPYIQNKKTLPLTLPDGEQLQGTLSGNLPSMDAASQTQQLILRVNTPHALPENLIARVRLTKAFRNNAPSLPRAAVLTDETQSEFWVMKLLNDSTAAKVPIQKGIESGDRMEILSPVFSAQDRILITGNYGLNDTARVRVVKE